uniref:BCAS3 domain-containing protein n=1 Tax=Syphacia muris TaxID=451379 RepID=A0A0N5AGS7_9BILA
MSLRSGQKHSRTRRNLATPINDSTSVSCKPTKYVQAPSKVKASSSVTTSTDVSAAVIPTTTTQAYNSTLQAQQFTPPSSSTSTTSDLKFRVLSSSSCSLRNSMRRGRNIKPQRVPETTFIGSVAGFVYYAIPQGSSSGQMPNERIEWVNMQKYDNAIEPEKSMDIVVFGLTRGFQIWAILESGECEEIVTERQGSLKTGRLLTCNPKQSFGVLEDKFEAYRPLFAFVDANSSVDRSCSTLSFISLVCRQHVHQITFPNQICAFEESPKALVVSFSNRLVICDALSLREQRYIYYSNGPVANNVFAMSDVFLSFADPTFSQCWQSCGGMMPENDFLSSEQSSYASSVVNAASSLTKAFSAWGESVVSSFSSSPQSKSHFVSSDNPGIVTVIDITKLPLSNDSDDANYYEGNSSDMLHENKVFEDSHSIIAHFIAHNEPLGFLKFGNGGRILLTSGQSSTCFHVFLLHPHPGSSALGAVQHIYTLNRGNTPAKVVGCTFSMDNRFVAVATNHGTTHLFAICPYGGPVSMRTHGSKLVNKDSRYHRSAGLDNSDTVPINEPIDLHNYQFGTPQVYKDHPSLIRPALARSARNPRIGPYANPIGLFASAKLRDSLSVDNLSAWASDIAAPLTTTRKRATSGPKNAEQNRIS